MHAQTSDLEIIPDRIRYGRELQYPAVAASREFLMTNGRYTCTSSFAGNTRRYHGLFIDRDHIVLSALHETINGISLLPGWWGDMGPDAMLRHLISTDLYPVVQEFAFGDLFLTRTISLGSKLEITWEVEGTADVVLRPLVTSRHVKELSFDPSATVMQEPGKILLNDYPYSCTLPFTEDHRGYYNAWYPAEASRGYDAQENLASPGFFSGRVSDERVTLLVHPTEPVTDQLLLPSAAPDLLDRASRLCLRENEIIAGFHWFTESWGRDTFISLPGLLLSYGRYREAEQVFRWHLKHRKGGLIPNRVPDSYHTSDATLWFFWSLFQYLQIHPNSPFVDEIIPDIEDLITQYPDNEVVSLDGNLVSVAPRSTWMDTPFTPREGRPVEVNALWILALDVCKYLDIETPVTPQAARSSFSSAFWNEETGCLYDVLGPDDPAVRPNQVVALALGLVPFDEGRRALGVIKRELLTPYGLRTLSPRSAGYYGSYAGDPSYHNGMVWPWLSGFYADALVQYGEPVQAVSRMLRPLWHHLFTDGAGQLPELFDGDIPHAPAGAVCQAWSIAELIRARNTALSPETTSQNP